MFAYSVRGLLRIILAFEFSLRRRTWGHYHCFVVLLLHYVSSLGVLASHALLQRLVVGLLTPHFVSHFKTLWTQKGVRIFISQRLMHLLSAFWGTTPRVRVLLVESSKAYLLEFSQQNGRVHWIFILRVLILRLFNTVSVVHILSVILRLSYWEALALSKYL